MVSYSIHSTAANSDAAHMAYFFELETSGWSDTAKQARYTNKHASGVMAACFTAKDTEDTVFAVSVITSVRNMGIKDSALAAEGTAIPMRFTAIADRNTKGTRGSIRVLANSPRTGIAPK